MTNEQTSKTTSLRCLLGAMSNILIMDWLTGDGKEHTFPLTANISELDDVVNNIETFFLKDIVLDKNELRDRYLPVMSSSWRSILHSVFFDAVIWWDAAHRSEINTDRYLNESQYSGEMLKQYRRFARFPMPPQAYHLTQGDFNDFRDLLVHSINLVSNSNKTFDEMKHDFSDDDWSFVTQELDEILRNEPS